MEKINWTLDIDVYKTDFEGHHYEAAANEAGPGIRVVRDRSFFHDLWNIYPITDYVEEGHLVEDLTATESAIRNWEKWEARRKEREAYLEYELEQEYMRVQEESGRTTEEQPEYEEIPF